MESSFSPHCQTQILNHLTYPLSEVPLLAECNLHERETRLDRFNDIITLSKETQFSYYNKNHFNEAKILIEILLKSESLTDFLLKAIIFRNLLSPSMFFYIISSAIIRHKQMRNYWIPHPFYIIPYDYFSDPSLSKVLNKMKTNQNIVFKFLNSKEKSLLKSNLAKFVENFKTNSNINNKSVPNSKEYLPYQRTLRISDTKVPIDINELQKIIVIKKDNTGNKKSLEHNLWYFREDIALNSAHFHWHLIHPHIPSDDNKYNYRKGELFFYFHRYVLRRYNAERFAFNMTKVKSLNDWNITVPEGYFPHLENNGQEYASRPDNMSFSENKESVDDLIKYTNEIKNAIQNGSVIDKDNETISLLNNKGIDVLAAIVEPSTSSPNTDLYGNLHNAGHLHISSLHDPLDKYKSSSGVMGFTNTALRDPVFYRWHQFIDDLFKEHKETLPCYSDNELNWNKISITNAFIINDKNSEKNQLFTYFNDRIIDVSKGLDFDLSNESVLVKIHHLDHGNFTYVINVNNPTKKLLKANVRIYLSPFNNENGEAANDKELHEQFFEMDVFSVKIKPGNRIITRSSWKSSVSSNPRKTWTNLEIRPEIMDDYENEDETCICGWPGHLMVPRGTDNGMPFIMLVFITDFEKDMVKDLKTNTSDEIVNCRHGSRLCGDVEKLYPDKQPMGFPFDRKFDFNKKEPFSKKFFNRTNMFLNKLMIYHLDNEYVIHVKP